MSTPKQSQLLKNVNAPRANHLNYILIVITTYTLSGSLLYILNIGLLSFKRKLNIGISCQEYLQKYLSVGKECTQTCSGQVIENDLTDNKVTATYSH